MRPLAIACAALPGTSLLAETSTAQPPRQGRRPQAGPGRYRNKLLPLVHPGGLILAHNMRRSPPAPRSIEAITTNPDLETSFLLMEGRGVGVTLKER